MNQTCRYACCMLAATFIFLAGCGEEKRKLPPANQLLVEAKKALVAGDADKAMELINASIESKPSAWAYFERAQLFLEKGDEASAKEDCARAVELDPENRDFKWLQEEIEKPTARRFKGKNQFPPSYSK